MALRRRLSPVVPLLCGCGEGTIAYGTDLVNLAGQVCRPRTRFCQDPLLLLLVVGDPDSSASSWSDAMLALTA